MIRNISDCSACAPALVSVTVLFLSSCGGGSTATDAAPATASGTVATVSGEPPCGIEGSGHQIESCTPTPVPTITSLYPSCAPKGAQAFNLLLDGLNFVASSVVRWNGSDRPTTFVSSSQLTAQISASDIPAAGTAAVTVFNPAAGGGSSNSLTVTTTTGGVDPQSIAVDPTGKFAYVANMGCFDAFVGNVSMYTINPTTGALTSIGVPVTADFGPHSVTVDPFGKFAYVANDGDFEVTGGSVSMYSIDPTSGALTPIGTIDTPCAPPPSPGSCAAYSVAVHPSGRFAYVANEGGYAPTSISMYTIDATTGTLTYMGLIAAGGRAVSVAVDPTGKFAYVATWSEPPLSAGNVSMYTINATTGTLTSTGVVAAGTDPVSVAVDRTGKFAYVPNANSDNVSMYTINATTGALTSLGLMAAGTGPTSVAMDPSGKFAYVTNYGSNNISMYTIDATTGALLSIGTIVAGLSPSSIAIQPTGKFAYVTNSGSNEVSVYSIDAATGTLTLIGTIGT